MMRALLFLILLIQAISIYNPGVLISVPFPLSPPPLDLDLPLPLSDLLVSGLELNNIELRQVDYSWRLIPQYAEVNVSRALLSFDWTYKKDSGKGFFIQDELRLELDWNFTVTKTNRFFIEILQTKIQPGKSKVELGGGVKESVAVEVTNIILNRASILFRSFIASKISSAITQATHILGDDLQIWKDGATGVSINTTLVVPPLISSQTLFLQINGAPYVTGESSGFLNPSQLLIKAPSTNIQVQIHRVLLSKIIDCIVRVKGGINMEFDTTTITSTIDIDSLALSPLFPGMAPLSPAKDVILTAKIPALTFQFSGQNFIVKGRGTCSVATKGKSDTSRVLYMNPLTAGASVELGVIFGARASSIRVQNLEVLDFTAQKEDIESGKIKPSALSVYFPQMMEWVKQAVNLVLNKKIVSLAYRNIKVIPTGKVLTSHSYNLELQLK